VNDSLIITVALHRLRSSARPAFWRSPCRWKYAWPP